MDVIGNLIHIIYIEADSLSGIFHSGIQYAVIITDSPQIERLVAETHLIGQAGLIPFEVVVSPDIDDIHTFNGHISID